MDQFLRTLFLSLETGAVYASFAVAIVIVYRTSRLLNFAQGEMATMGVFVVWQLHSESGLPFIGETVPLGVAIVLGLLFSAVLGAVIERLFIRPVASSRNPLAPVIVTIALFLAINGLVGYVWTRQPQVLPNPFPDDVGWSVGGAEFTATTLGCLLVLLVEGAFLVFLFQHTKVGLGLRAVATNVESSRLVGVPVGRMLMIGWGLAAVAGTVAALLQTAVLPAHSFDPNLMIPTLVFGFAAATLGGFDSVYGAVVGGMMVAFVEKFSLQYVEIIGPELAVGSAFVLILVVLTVRPQGLFGHVEVTRV
jgi:branched-chain amino acid transport system permease protein